MARRTKDFSKIPTAISTRLASDRLRTEHRRSIPRLSARHLV
jgi:hypothetical protein